MEKEIIKRKINKVKTLNARRVGNRSTHALMKERARKVNTPISENRFQVGPFVQVKPKKAKRERKNRIVETANTCRRICLSRNKSTLV